MAPSGLTPEERDVLHRIAERGLAEYATFELAVLDAEARLRKCLVEAGGYGPQLAASLRLDHLEATDSRVDLFVAFGDGLVRLHCVNGSYFLASSRGKWYADLLVGVYLARAGGLTPPRARAAKLACAAHLDEDSVSVVNGYLRETSGAAGASFMLAQPMDDHRGPDDLLVSPESGAKKRWDFVARYRRGLFVTNKDRGIKRPRENEAGEDAEDEDEYGYESEDDDFGYENVDGDNEFMHEKYFMSEDETPSEQAEPLLKRLLALKPVPADQGGATVCKALVELGNFFFANSSSFLFSPSADARFRPVYVMGGRVDKEAYY